jgi:hypothetical protein
MLEEVTFGNMKIIPHECAFLALKNTLNEVVRELKELQEKYNQLQRLAVDRNYEPKN